MITTGSIFILFYAIFWGSVANVQPRWKAFQWPLIFRSKVIMRRVLLSLLLLNIMPLLYFGIILSILNNSQTNSIVCLIFNGIVPAFAVFGFYRVWLGIIELNPALFYYKLPANVPLEFGKSEPNIAELWYAKEDNGCAYRNMEITTGMANIVTGVIYIIIGFAGLLINSC